jgi:hypothetical protein
MAPTWAGSCWRRLRGCQGRRKWQEQYKLLDSWYKYWHRRETVTERREKQRDAYHNTVAYAVETKEEAGSRLTTKLR